MKPFISIIVPMFNSEDFIHKCLDSILNQSYENFELIVVDDGSTDSSVNIVNSFYDSRIKLYCLSHGGVSNSRNYGINVSKGSYVIFIDSDDYIEFNMLEKFVDIINKYNPDFISCGFFSETALSKKADLIKHNDFFYKNPKIFKKYIVNLYNNHILYNVWNKIFKKEIINKYSIRFPNINFGEDCNFIMEYIVHSKSFYNIGDCLYHYIRENKNSITTSYIPDLFKIRLFENKVFIHFFDEYGLDYSEYIDFISKRFIERTIGCLENIHRKNGLSFREKYMEVDNIIHNSETKKYLKIYKTNNRKIKIIIYTYRLNSPFLAFSIGYCLYLFKKIMPSYFNNLKNSR